MVASGLLWRTLLENPPGDFAIVEGKHVGTDDLVRLVTLTRYHHRITGVGPMQRVVDRPGAVGLDRVAARLGTGRAHTDEDLVDDRLRPLRAGVVRGHPDPVGEAGGGRARAPALGARAAVPTPHGPPPQPPRRLARRGQHPPAAR